MFTKKQEIKDPQSCLNRSADDEPVFVLVGRDRTAPDAIREWARLARIAGSPPEKVQQALDDAVTMAEWQEQNPKSVKTPD